MECSLTSHSQTGRRFWLRYCCIEALGRVVFHSFQEVRAKEDRMKMTRRKLRVLWHAEEGHVDQQVLCVRLRGKEAQGEAGVALELAQELAPERGPELGQEVVLEEALPASMSRVPAEAVVEALLGRTPMYTAGCLRGLALLL